MAGNPYEETLEDLEQAPAPKKNPYLETLEAQDRDRALRLQTAERAAKDTTPDRAAEVRRLSESMNLPAAVVDRHFDSIKKRATDAGTFESMMRDTPTLAKWLENPQNAAIGQDDIPHLSALDRTMQIGRNLIGAAGAGVAQFSAGLWSFLRQQSEQAMLNPQVYGPVTSEILGRPGVADFAAGASRVASVIADRMRGKQEGAGFAEKAVYGGVESFGMMAPGLGLALLGGGTPAMLSVMGATTSGLSYDEARAQGVDPGKANLYAAMDGAIEVATEKIPAVWLLKDLGGSSVVKTIANQLISEIPGEQVATVLQDLNAWATLPANAERTFADYLAERPSAAAATLISTIVVAGMATGAGHGTRRMLQQLGATAEQSATLKRSPEAVAELLEAAGRETGSTTLYQDVQEWAAYWQEQGVDPRAKATEVTGDPDAYDNAVTTGQALEIPLSRYAVTLAGTEHNAHFANTVRISADETNGNEADATLEALLAAEVARAEEADRQADARGGLDAMRGDLVEQLRRVGYDKTAAEANVTLALRAATLEIRAGFDPLAALSKYGLKVERTTYDQYVKDREAERAARKTSQTPAGATGGDTVEALGPEAGDRSPGAAVGAAAGAGGEGSGELGAQAPGTPRQAADPTSPAGVLEAAGLQPDAGAATLAGDGDTQGQAGAGDGAAGAAAREGDRVPGAAAEPVSTDAQRNAATAGRTGSRQARGTNAVPAPWRGYFASLVADARERGYAGDDDSLADLFLQAVADSERAAADLNAELAEGVPTAGDLLAKIATLGGFGIEAEGKAGMRGELEHMLESLTRQGIGVNPKTQRALPRAFRQVGKLPGGSKGQYVVRRKGGKPADTILESVREDPRWENAFDNLADFLQAVADAVAIETGVMKPEPTGHYTPIGVLQGVYDVQPGSPWWQSIQPASLEILDAGDGVQNNASGESAASLEAMNRQRSMQARGESYVVYDRTGTRRPLIGVDAVDYVAQEGESYGIEGPNGFQLLDDRGGAYPKQPTVDLLEDTTLEREVADAGVVYDLDATSFDPIDFLQEDPTLPFDLFAGEQAAVVDKLSTGELQPRLPGAESVRDQEVKQPEVADLPFTLTAPTVKEARPKKVDAGPSREFLEARGAFATASDAFTEAQRAFRAKEIDAPAFVAARTAYDAAMAAYDAAEQAEVERRNLRGEMTLFQADEYAVTQAQLDQFAAELKANTPDLVELDLRVTKAGAVHLETIAVTRGGTNAGVGSGVMQAITRFADDAGVRLELQLAKKGYHPSDDAATTSSRARLEKFYRRFGFVSNKGRRKRFDLSIYTSMYREPTVKVAGPKAPITGPDSPAFRQWFGDSKIVDAEGKPLVVYHGTTGDFVEFDRERGNIESDFGRGIYFTNEPEDVSVNYAGEGPDLTQKIQLRAERIAQETDRDYNDEDVKAEAREQLGVQHGGMVLPVYLKIENPAIIGGDDETVLTYDVEYDISDGEIDQERLDELLEDGLTPEEARRQIAQESGEISGEVGTLVDFIEALRSEAFSLDDAETDRAIEGLMERGADGDLTLRQAIEIVSNDTKLTYATDENGDLAIHELVRRTLERMGFDGIIDRTVNDKFGSNRDIGKAMEGMNEDTVHYIVFDPARIKSATGNRGTYDRSRNILHQGEKRGAKRGAIRFGRHDRQMTIALFEQANLSTFVHEAGHFYLEVFGDVVDALRAMDPATLNDSQRKLMADYMLILKAIGVESREQIQTEHHETFARLFEAYLMEGKAPAEELRPVFARVRAWMLDIYQSLRSLRVSLTPEVRSVFDRMLATDAEIALVEQSEGIGPMFTTAEQAGKTPAEFELYREDVEAASRQAREQLEVRVLSELRREETEEWRRRRAEVEAQVRADLEQEPVHRAMAAILKGTTPAGQPLIEGMDPEPLTLDRKAAIDAFGKDRIKRLPRGVASAMGVNDPEVIARMFGFSSADMMLAAIEVAPKFEDRVRAETQARMLAEYGSILLDGSLHERARAAVANTKRDSVVRAEMRALRKLERTVAPFVQAGEDALAAERREREYERRWFEAEGKLAVAIVKGQKQEEIDALRDEVRRLKRWVRGGPRQMRENVPSDKAVLEAARRAIAGRTVRAIRPQPYWQAARKAAQLAIEAAAGGQYARALQLKGQELLNLALYRTAIEALEQIETRVRKAKDMSRGAGRGRLGLAGAGIAEQVDQILDRFSLAAVSLPPDDERTSIAEWVLARQRSGDPIDLSLEVLDGRRVDYKDLAYGAFINVTDDLEQLAHLARDNNKLLKAERVKKLDEAAHIIADSIADHAKKRTPAPIESRLPQHAFSRGMAGFFAWQRKLSSLAREMDGGIDGGPMWEFFVRPANVAADTENVKMEAAAVAYLEAIGGFSAADMASMNRLQRIDEIGDSMTRAGMIMLALNWGNEGNRQRMLSGYRWTEAQAVAVMNRLDESDWRFVRATWAQVGSYGAEIAAKQKRVYGVAPTMIEATPFMTRFGEQPGGYFPIKFDEETDPKAFAQAVEEQAQRMMAGAITNATTKRGFTKERAKKVIGRRVQLDFSVIWGHVADVIHDLTHHEMLIDMNRLLRHPLVSQAIREHYGMPVYRELQAAMKDIAAGDSPAQHQGDRVLRWFLTGTSIARMGWNLMTGLVQPLGASVATTRRVGPKWVARGAARFLGDAARMQNTVKWIWDQSSMMRLRHKTFTREVAEVRNRLQPRGSYVLATLGGKLAGNAGATAGFAVASKFAALEETYFYLIGKAQLVADTLVWLGEYEKASADATNDPARVIALADQAVLDTQGSGMAKDLARSMRDPKFKLFTQFMGYFSVIHNQGAEAVGTTRMKNPLQVGRLAVDLLILYTVPMLLEEMIRGAVRGDDDDEDGVLLWFAKNQASYLMSTVVGVRELAGLPQGFRYKGPAATGVVGDIGDLAVQIGQWEVDEQLLEALNKVGGVLFHYPATGVERMVRSAVALEDAGVTDALAALAGRKPPKE